MMMMMRRRRRRRYNSQDYWVFGLSSSSYILKCAIFRKLDLFPSSDEG
jgi:hypothetical protein